MAASVQDKTPFLGKEGKEKREREMVGEISS